MASKMMQPKTTIKGRRGGERPAAAEKILTPKKTSERPSSSTKGPLADVKPEDVKIQISRTKQYEIARESREMLSKLPELSIVRTNISLYSWEEMQNQSVCEVTSSDTKGYESVNDPRMGVIGMGLACSSCGQIDCPGHYGRIKFKRPIFNPLSIRLVVSVLTAVCNTCGSLLLDKASFEREGLYKLSAEKRLNRLEALSAKLCCRKHQTLDELSIWAEEYGISTDDKTEQEIRDELAEKVDPDLIDEVSRKKGKMLKCPRNPKYFPQKIIDTSTVVYKFIKGKEDKTEGKEHSRTAEDVEAIFNRISKEDSLLMGFSSGSHPSQFIMKGMLVIPPIARPPDYQGGAIVPDQITQAIIQIVKANNKIVNPTDPNTDLYLAVKHLIDGKDGRFHTHGKEFVSIQGRIQGKGALMRETLMGKRGNYSARTVVGPDPSLKFGEISIPEAIANIITIPNTVTEFNYESLLELLRRGRITHIKAKQGRNRDLRQMVKSGHEYNIRIGDEVERLLQDGDWVILNRQPTLRKQSMMAGRARVVRRLTIGIPLAYTPAFNADFDGDEMNLVVPQSEEAIAEAIEILNLQKCVIAAGHNVPIMGLVYDAVTGAYLMTDPKMMMDDELFLSCIDDLTESKQLATLFNRCEKYGVNVRSGKALFSALLPENFYYQKGDVIIIDGILTNGRITNQHIGASHRSIVQDIWKTYGDVRTSEFLTDAPFLIDKWLTAIGFSIGIGDCFSDDPRHAQIIKEEKAKSIVNIQALGPALKNPIEEEERERKIVGILNNVKGIGVKIAKEIMSKDNALGTMSKEVGGGAKGTPFNVGQIMGIIGQQFFRGMRLKPGPCSRRTLPVFEEDDEDIEAYGFIPNSFLEGMNPPGFFFHHFASREGLTDTANKTAQTGYMEHRIVKALEDVRIGASGVVTNTNGVVFQSTYGLDGFDGGQLMKVNGVNGEVASFIDIKSVTAQINSKYGWVPKKVIPEGYVYQGLSVMPSGEMWETEEGEKKERRNLFGWKAAWRPKVIAPVQLENPPEPEEFKPMGSVRITRFERAHLIGKRAKQISQGSSPMIDIGELTSSIDIARAEFEQRKIPLIVKRVWPDGGETKIDPNTVEH